MLPVLATLLQSDQNDYAMIEEGKNKMSWWGSVDPKVIGSAEEDSSAYSYVSSFASMLAGPTATDSTAAGSAEVSVSQPSSEQPGRSRTSSLQF